MTFAGGSDLAIAATVGGPADGPPVLLAHGGGQTKRAWRRTTERMNEAGFRTIAIDLRGHGESGWSENASYALDDFARDILYVSGQLDRRPAFVGASLGGLSGLIAEGELRPGSFSSLTLVDVTPRVDQDGVKKISAFMSSNLERGFASLEEAAEAIGNYTPNREKRAPSEGLSHYLRKGVDGRYRWHWDPAFITSRTGQGPMAAERLESAAAKLSLPVHLIRGERSELVTTEGVRAFLEFVPHARFDEIAGAGHMVVGDRNDAFSDTIVDFLESIIRPD